jgi:hypothetical protein
MLWNAWLPGTWGAVPAVIAGAWVLAAGWTRRRRGQESEGATGGSGRPAMRPAQVSAIVLAVAIAHVGLASLPRSQDARELRAVLTTRATAFEMIGRDDLAASLREALDRVPGR